MWRPMPCPPCPHSCTRIDTPPCFRSQCYKNICASLERATLKAKAVTKDKSPPRLHALYAISALLRESKKRNKDKDKLGT